MAQLAELSIPAPEIQGLKSSCRQCKLQFTDFSFLKDKEVELVWLDQSLIGEKAVGKSGRTVSVETEATYCYFKR